LKATIYERVKELELNKTLTALPKTYCIHQNLYGLFFVVALSQGTPKRIVLHH
jgi:hypothetical protein